MRRPWPAPAPVPQFQGWVGQLLLQRLVFCSSPATLKLGGGGREGVGELGWVLVVLDSSHCPCRRIPKFLFGGVVEFFCRRCAHGRGMLLAKCSPGMTKTSCGAMRESLFLQYVFEVNAPRIRRVSMWRTNNLWNSRNPVSVHPFCEQGSSGTTCGSEKERRLQFSITRLAGSQL